MRIAILVKNFVSFSSSIVPNFLAKTSSSNDDDDDDDDDDDKNNDDDMI